MHPRFVGRLGLADAVTAANAALGFCAVGAAVIDVGLAARLILLAAIADGLDGLIARRRGGTPVGEHLDSLADVASFGVAPAFLAFLAATEGLPSTPRWTALAFVVPAGFVAMAVIRLGLYTAYDTGNAHTEGVQTTLAATLIAAGALVGLGPGVLLAATGVLATLMVTTVRYPDLLARDALVMGAIQALAVLVPGVFGGLFPKALLVWALAYLVLAPRFYWRREGKRS